MSSNALTVETGVSDESPTAGGAVSDRGPRSRFDVERKLLCDRIEELERELVRERHRREQVIDQYECLLDRRRENESDAGWLRKFL